MQSRLKWPDGSTAGRLTERYYDGDGQSGMLHMRAQDVSFVIEGEQSKGAEATLSIQSRLGAQTPRSAMTARSFSRSL